MTFYHYIIFTLTRHVLQLVLNDNTRDNKVLHLYKLSIGTVIVTESISLQSVERAKESRFI